MSSSKPTIGYATRVDAVMALKAEGLTPKQIAAKTGMTLRHVYNTISASKRLQLRISLPHGVLSLKASKAVAKAAEKRGVRGRELVRRLIEVIAQDNMFDAVLDDLEDGK